MVNKIWDWDETRPNSTLWEFSVTPFSKNEELAKARVQEVRSQMTIDKIGEKVKGWLNIINPENMMPWEMRNSINAEKLLKNVWNSRFTSLSEDPAFLKGIKEGKELKEKLNKIDDTKEELRKVFDNCESGSETELLIIKNIINNPKTTPEDLDYYFFNVKEDSEAEFLVAKALIAHPNLTQKLFDKNYGMAMQKWGPVFDLFEIADQERNKKK